MRKSIGWFAASGAIIGLIGLTGGESFLVGVSTGVAVTLVQGAVPRLRALGALMGPLVAVYGLWILPILFSYFDLGGFVNITHITPVVLPALGFLGAWAPAIAFGIWGLVLAIKRLRSDLRARILLAVLGAALFSLVTSSLIPAFFGDAFSTLETKHRYWPYVYLALALIAAYGFADLLGRLLKKNAGGAALLAAVVFAVGLTSPVVAGVAVSRTDPAKPLYRLVHSSLMDDRRTVLSVLADTAPGKCVVAVPEELSRAVFGLTGYRQVLWQGDATGDNRATDPVEGDLRPDHCGERPGRGQRGPGDGNHDQREVDGSRREVRRRLRRGAGRRRRQGHLQGIQFYSGSPSAPRLHGVRRGQLLGRPPGSIARKV